MTSGRPGRGWMAAAALWSAAYGMSGIHWATGGAGFPFGAGHDPWAHLSALAAVRPARAAPVIATLGLLGALGAVAMAGGWGHGRGRGAALARGALLTLAWAFAAALTLVVPDARVLAVAGYTPLLVVGPLLGWPSDGRVAVALSWPIVNQLVCLGGGLLWAAAAVAYQRRTRGACTSCGRTDRPAAWTTPRAAARWGRWAVAIAAAVPPTYAVTRLAWAFGIPLGGHAAELRVAQAVEGGRVLVAPLALGCTAIAGSLLTLGLVQRWGELFPSWLPLMGGRRVPPALVVAPAAVVSALVLAAGLAIVRLWAAGRFVIEPESWLGSLPMLLWPLWGAALAAATLAYHYRRRGACAACGRS
ncbi:MAG TPA: hypothetical protein VFS08_12885 [Gemmatimonadaceae bacterium]|nr:hypothetical protein [Gemmatimonadaceae bacterium]